MATIGRVECLRYVKTAMQVPQEGLELAVEASAEVLAVEAMAAAVDTVVEAASEEVSEDVEGTAEVTVVLLAEIWSLLSLLLIRSLITLRLAESQAN